jgi:hypothetical protein
VGQGEFLPGVRSGHDSNRLTGESRT